jgi:UDP-N-acetyl-D-glucosamine dehydrogenase
VTTALDGQKIALNSARIIVIRVAYKTHVDDLRESPALTIIELRQKKDMPG